MTHPRRILSFALPVGLLAVFALVPTFSVDVPHLFNGPLDSANGNASPAPARDP